MSYFSQTDNRTLMFQARESLRGRWGLSIGALEAITKSKEMMRGNKAKYFFLGCRFIGWAIVCILTLGIGFLWFYPYIMVSLAKFYEDLKEVE
jgi:uncharacterized membrane protein